MYRVRKLKHKPIIFNNQLFLRTRSSLNIFFTKQNLRNLLYRNLEIIIVLCFAITSFQLNYGCI